MDSEVIRLAIGLNKVRDIVEKQKQRKLLRSEELTQISNSDNQLMSDNESRVYYDLPIRLGLHLSDDQINNNYNINKIDDHFSDKRSDNRKSAQNIENTNQLFSSKLSEKMKFNRKVVITDSFKDIDENIPQWVSPIDVFNDNFIRNRLINNKIKYNKPLVTKQTKIAVLKTDYDYNEDHYKNKTRSMTNLPLNKLEKLIQNSHKVNDNINDDKCRKIREKSYDVKTIQNYIKQKRLESKESKKEDNKKAKEKFYDQKIVRDYMEKQKEIRKKQFDSNRDEKVVKCYRKSYDPLVVRKYINEKKKKLHEKQMMTENIVKTNAKDIRLNSVDKSNKCVENEFSLKCELNEVIDSKSVDNEKRSNTSANEIPFDEKLNDIKDDEQNGVTKIELNDNSKSSPTKSPAKGHRRQEPIMNSEHLKEMLTQIINGSGDSVSPIAQYKSLPNRTTNNSLINHNLIKPVSVIKMPDYSSLNGTLNGSMSGISCLTNSIATNEELSPLTLSPNSSLFSKSLSLKSEDISSNEINDNSFEKSIKQLIDRAVTEVPTWDQLCERVYKTKIKSKTQSKPIEMNNDLVETQTTRQSSPVSPKSSKAMEIFPHFILKPTKTQNDIQQKPKFIEHRFETLSPQRTPSPVLDSNDDSLKSLPSLSSSSSSTTTPSTTKSVSPAEVVIDLSLIDKNSDNSRLNSPSIVEEIRNSISNSYSSNFDSMSPSSGSQSIHSNDSNTTIPKELSVLERVGKIRKEHNLSNGELSDQSINRSTKLSQHDLFRLTPDIEDFDDGIDEDDATDNVSSIKSEEGIEQSITSSNSQTITSGKPSEPELIADLNITEFIHNEAIHIFRAQRSEESIKGLEFRHKNRTPFKLFLFDLCKEITLRQFSFDNDLKITLKLPLKLQKHVWSQNEETFASIITKKVKDIINKNNIKPDIKKDGLMGFCRKSKKRDLVDSVLYEEICLEDMRWAYFEPEIVIIKEKISDMILKQLVSEAVDDWYKIRHKTDDKLL